MKRLIATIIALAVFLGVAFNVEKIKYHFRSIIPMHLPDGDKQNHRENHR